MIVTRSKSYLFSSNDSRFAYLISELYDFPGVVTSSSWRRRGGELDNVKDDRGPSH
jgi:hypothetical protein